MHYKYADGNTGYNTRESGIGGDTNHEFEPDGGGH